MLSYASYGFAAMAFKWSEVILSTFTPFVSYSIDRGPFSVLVLNKPYISGYRLSLRRR